MGRIVTISATPTITASSAYTSGNALGGKLTFTSLLQGMQGKIISATVSDKSNSKIAADLLIFNQDFTATTDKSAIAVSAADLLNMVGVVSFATGDYVSCAASTNALATKSNVNLAAVAAVDNNLYGQLVTRGTPTYGSTSDITVKLTVELSID